MSKAKLKKYVKGILFLLLGIFVVYSLYIYSEYRNYINLSIERNYDSLWRISNNGSNLANRLEDFIHLPAEEEGNSDVSSELSYNWVLVNAENRNINSFLLTISPYEMEDAASDWDLLQFSLLRVQEFINGMTNQFLENQSYVTSSEDKEKMEAVITVFRTIGEIEDVKSVDFENLLQSIEEPMLIISENYSDALKRMGR